MSSVTLLPKRAPVDTEKPPAGTVYTDTVIFSPPEAFVKDAPYQIAIVDLDDGERTTVRIDGDNVVIGDRVEFVELRNGIPFYRKPL
jgi:uncharacterized OB-fold protein